jgi:hypothetical protein
MKYLNLAMIAVFFGIHYPVARWYVARVLSELDSEVARGVRTALALRMRVLFSIWSISCAGSLAVLAAFGFSERVTGTVSGAAIIGFHLIWWPFVVPVFRRLELELKSRGVERSRETAGPTRTATLAPRVVGSYLNPWMRLLPVFVAAGGVSAVTWRTAMYPPSEPRFWFMVLTFAASALFFWIAWSIWVRKEISASYPVDGPAKSAPDRIAAAESMRRFRVLGIYWFQVAASVFFFAAAVLCIEVDRGAIAESTVGIFGGVGGTLLGVAGGVFGTIAGVRMHRVMRRGKVNTA